MLNPRAMGPVMKPILPTLNATTLAGWRARARAMGLSDKGSKLEVYLRIIAAIEGGAKFSWWANN